MRQLRSSLVNADVVPIAVLGVISTAIGLRGFDKFRKKPIRMVRMGHAQPYNGRTSEEELVAELTMERFLKWKILPRLMMGVMTWMYMEHCGGSKSAAGGNDNTGR